MCALCVSPLQADEHASDAGALFVKCPPFLIPVIQEARLQAIYNLSFVIETTSKETTDKAQKIMPKIVDAIYTDLYSLLALIWTAHLNINIIDLKTRLFKICQRILGQNSVKSILVQDLNRQIIQ